jgi:hypothetical protein
MWVCQRLFDTFKNAKTLIGTLIQRGEKMQGSPARELQWVRTGRET